MVMFPARRQMFIHMELLYMKLHLEKNHMQGILPFLIMETNGEYSSYGVMLKYDTGMKLCDKCIKTK